MPPLASEPEQSAAMSFYRMKRCSALHFGVGKILEDAEQDGAASAAEKHLLSSFYFQTFARDVGFRFGSSEQVINDDIEAIAINYFGMWRENALATGNNFDPVTISDLNYCVAYLNKILGSK